jgi:hypothetical protein
LILILQLFHLIQEGLVMPCLQFLHQRNIGQHIVDRIIPTLIVFILQLQLAPQHVDLTLQLIGRGVLGLGLTPILSQLVVYELHDFGLELAIPVGDLFQYVFTHLFCGLLLLDEGLLVIGHLLQFLLEGFDRLSELFYLAVFFGGVVALSAELIDNQLEVLFEAGFDVANLDDLVELDLSQDLSPGRRHYKSINL